MIQTTQVYSLLGYQKTQNISLLNIQGVYISVRRNSYYPNNAQAKDKSESINTWS